MRPRAALPGLALWLFGALASLSAAETEPAADRPLELWFSVVAPTEVRNEFIREVARELGRTPQRHAPRFLETPESAEELDEARVLAAFEIRLDSGRSGRPAVRLARAGHLTSPGWLVHAVLGAARTVDVDVTAGGGGLPWIAQLVRRSTRPAGLGPADARLASGVPAVAIDAPSQGEAAARLVAAVARRLDGLDGPPVYEDRYLVAFDRVWLRRDLYWLGLALWLLLFWRARASSQAAGAREFRWLFLVATLVAPAFAAVLLTLPALVVSWLSERRWAAAVALVPTGLYLVGWAMALSTGARPAFDLLSAAPVAAALAIFAWTSLLGLQPLLAPVTPSGSD